MITGILSFLLRVISALLDVYKLLIIVYVVLNLLKVPANKWTELLRSVVEPALEVTRKLMARYLPASWQRIDWSPVALFVAISLLQLLI